MQSASTVPGSPSPSPIASVPASPLPTSTSAVTAAPTLDARETDASSARGWMQDPPKPLLLGGAVRVIVDELNLRARPSTSATRIWTMPRDTVIGVGNPNLPPVEADGYIWYSGTAFRSLDGELPPLPEALYEVADPVGGWFAVMKGATPFVEPLAPRCPSVVDVRNLGAMLAAERLACFGGDAIEFEDTYGCPECGGNSVMESKPSWLADLNIIHLVREVGTRDFGFTILVRFPPEGPGPPADGSIIHIRGHFDDPTASNCRLSIAQPWGDFVVVPVPSAFARLWCRQMLVVDGYDLIGTDPAFPG